MTTVKLDYAEKGDKRLQASYQGYFEGFSASLDGNEIGSLPDRAALREGGTFSAPDGAQLTFKLEPSWLFNLPELHAHKNGEPIFGTAAHPAKRMIDARNTMWGVGILLIVVTVVILIRSGFSMEAAGETLLGAVIFLVLAALATLGGWAAVFAFGLTILLLVLATLGDIVNVFNPPPGTGALGIIGSVLIAFGQVLFIMTLYHGIRSVLRLRAESA